MKHSCSARDQIPWRLVFDSFPYSSFHTSEETRHFLSGERFSKSCVLASLRSKRFQSSYCAKVRALVSTFLDELARKRLLRRLRFSECLILIWVISVDGRLIPRKKMLFQKTEKGVCSRRLRYAWRGADVFNVFYFLHRLSAPCTLYIYNISHFTRRFEFPACSKLVRGTITSF